MSKILTTQLTGFLQRIGQSEEESIEETARLLAQAAIGQGMVYFACFGEMESIALNAELGADPFIKYARYSDNITLSDADRVIIFTRSCDDQNALTLAKKLYDAFIPFAAVASEVASDANELSELAYTYISLRIRGGILPHPTKLGERIVMPHLIGGLYVYEAIKMEFDEMLAGDDDEDEIIEGHPSPFA
ncbi:DUF2529 domain-containing protein [Lysinibacillus sp. 2017]|uniref:DUF2529 family protein n=1 Tax=unclassified Lysinibacillus TaxID=2636778 RepID=UPI000D52713D|nr:MULTISPECIES: DUF2529 family protein [unclassified Lysinibacillus]AWE06280.1 DUF2529 domain-containing protein [Lysinibacillus sp. 2017]TGN35244.1 DUF2529 family protein [Lysinibacillus sp. S2017]